MSISDLLRQEIWGVIYLKLLYNFHLSLPKTFLLLGIMAGQREKPHLVLRLPMDTDPSTCPSTEKTCWPVKLKHAANVRTCIVKPRLLQINTKKPNTLDSMFPDFTGNYRSYRGGMWKATWTRLVLILSTADKEELSLLTTHNLPFLKLHVVVFQMLYYMGRLIEDSTFLVFKATKFVVSLYSSNREQLVWLAQWWPVTDDQICV